METQKGGVGNGNDITECHIEWIRDKYIAGFCCRFASVNYQMLLLNIHITPKKSRLPCLSLPEMELFSLILKL